MAQCAGITQAGERCQLEATEGSYCWSHAPENAQARKLRARRGGRIGGNGRPGGRELTEVKSRLRSLAEAAADGSLEARRATASAQLWNAWLRAAALERDVQEQEELVERVERMEARLRERLWGT